MDDKHFLQVTLEDMEQFAEALDMTESECDGTAKIIAAAFAKKLSDWDSNIRLYVGK